MRGLEGIKVVELTSYVAAPACPRILGEMGATIFKIEPASLETNTEQTDRASAWRKPIPMIQHSIMHR